LIDATRKAVAVVGLDSGPLHLAALLRKPGVGLFGPTDPERNGPYGGTVKVLRAAGAETTYKRGEAIAPSMEAIGVEQVWTALKEVLG
jgi:heptosyltransferase-1